jgi:iron complex transport system permease protein
MMAEPVGTRSSSAATRFADRGKSFWLVALVMAMVVLTAMSVAIGTRDVSFADIIAGLGGRTDSIGQAAVSVRIPRTLLAVLAGASLAVAGTVMQGVTRNPLAEPGILGVNMGASLAVAIGVAWFGIVSTDAFIWTAIFGAWCTALFVYTIGSLGRGGATPLKLALAGTATSIAFVSLVLAVVMTRNDISGGLQAWQIGGVGGATFDRIVDVLPFLILGFLICLVSARKLNSLALGDDLAAGLGERVALTRATAAFGAVLLCGATTAVCGPIAFVGLVVPHLCRLLVGTDHRWLVPFTAVTGACLLLLADITGRVIARPSELDVGIVTAFVGAPFFIWVVRRQRIRDL